jgi:hypothetical protein
MFKGNCAIWGRVKCQFVKSSAVPAESTSLLVANGVSGSDLVGMLNKVSKNFQLPLQKFIDELHIPGMSFTGPGTRLE